jgi:hypothetical protein
VIPHEETIPARRLGRLGQVSHLTRLGEGSKVGDVDRKPHRDPIMARRQVGTTARRHGSLRALEPPSLAGNDHHHQHSPR